MALPSAAHFLCCCGPCHRCCFPFEEAPCPYFLPQVALKCDRGCTVGSCPVCLHGGSRRGVDFGNALDALPWQIGGEGGRQRFRSGSLNRFRGPPSNCLGPCAAAFRDPLSNLCALARAFFPEYPPPPCPTNALPSEHFRN